MPNAYFHLCVQKSPFDRIPGRQMRLLRQSEPPKGFKTIVSRQKSPVKPLDRGRNVIGILKSVDRRQMTTDLAAVTQ